MPSTNDYTRIIDVLDDDVRSANPSTLVRVFGEIAAQSEQAKHVRGRVFLSFPLYESDARPNYVIPQVRAYIRKLDEALPYFPYFLVADPALGHVLMYLLCLIDLTPAGEYAATDLMEAVQRKMIEIAALCARIGDDADRATDPLFLNLPAAIVKTDALLLERTLKAMRLALVGFETSLVAGRPPAPEARQFFDDVLKKACALAGIDRSAFKSDLEVLRVLRGRTTPPVSKQDVETFDAAFDRCLERVPGRKLRADMACVRALVRAQEAAAYRFVEAHARMAASQPGYLQPAAIVAHAIYEELGDRSAMLQIERRAEELGVTRDTWGPTRDDGRHG